jgi:hypothetical protein
LKEKIDGYEQLEILLLLHADAHSRWAGESVSKRIRLGLEDTKTALDALATRRLLRTTKEGETVWFQYVLGDGEVDRVVEALAHAYAENRLDVMQAMNAIAIERVRTAAIRTFAEAFVLRPKRK